MALRLFVAVAALIASSSAFTAPVASVMVSQSARASAVTMFSSSKKAAPKKAAPAAKAAAPVKKAAPKKAAAPVAKKAAPAPAKKAAPAPAKKAAPAPAKKAPAKRTVVSSGKRSSSTEGKGGIFPWVTNQPGTYAKQLFLSGVDFLGADGDKWIGWGAMPDSVKKLYNRKGRKGLLPQ